MPPGNDAFASRTTISGSSGSQSGTTVAATNETNEPAAGYDPYPTTPFESVWYEFTPPTTGKYYIAVTAPLTPDVYLTFYTGTVLTALSYVSAFSPGSPYAVVLTAGTAYKIQAAALDGMTPSAFTFTWAYLPPSANDDFANRTTLTGDSGSTTLNTGGDTVEGSEPRPWYQVDPQQTEWFEWVAPTTGYYRFDCEGSDSDTCLAIWTGSSIGSLTAVARNDDSYRDTNNFYPAIVGFHATSGTSYKIQVEGRGGLAVILRWQPLVLAANNDFANATDLTLIDNIYHLLNVNNFGCNTQASEPDPGPTFDAVLSPHSPPGASFGRSIWFTYENAGPEYVKIWLNMHEVSGASIGMAAYTGTTLAGLSLMTTENARVGGWYDLPKGVDAVDIWDFATAVDEPSGYLDPMIVMLAPGETLYLQISGITYTTYALEGPFDYDYTQWQGKLQYRAQKVYRMLPHTDPGPARGTLTVTGSTVGDTQVPDLSRDAPSAFSLVDLDTSFFVRNDNLPPNGEYVVRLKYRFGGPDTDVANQILGALVRVNDLALSLPASFGISDAATTDNADEAYFTITGLPMLDAINNDEFDADTNATVDEWGGGPEFVSIKDGDVVEICCFVTADIGGRDPRYLEVLACDFFQVRAGGGPGDTIDLVTMPDLPLGATNWTDSGTNGADLKAIRGSALSGGSVTATKDLCVTSNGDVYVLVSTGDQNFSTSKYYLQLWRWNGTTWTCINNNLSGHGNPVTYATESTRITSFACAIDTDGTNVYAAWGERDGTITASHGNWLWRCKKYTGGSGGSFSELGSGQAKVPGASRLHLASDAATYETGIQLKVGPDNTVWVGWAESDDIAPLTKEITRAYLWYWNGSAWVDSNLPAPPGITDPAVGSWYVNTVNVDPQWQVDFTFCHHDGPSNWPSAIYNYFAYNSSGGAFRSAGFVYQEYDGASWSNVLTFDPWVALFPNDAGLDSDDHIRYAHLYGTAHWQQGMSLFDNGAVVFFAVSGNDRGPILIRLEQDGTQFSSWPGTYQQPDYLSRQDERHGPSFVLRTPSFFFSGAEGGWVDPTGCDALCDPEGRIWVLYDPIMNQYATALVRLAEVGNGYSWTLASKHNNPMAGDIDSVGFSRFYYHGGALYTLIHSRWTDGGTHSTLGVWRAPVDDTYEAFDIDFIAEAPASGIVIAFEDDPFGPDQTWIRQDDPTA